MICPKCKTEARAERREGRLVHICRDPKCPDCGKEVGHGG